MTTRLLLVLALAASLFAATDQPVFHVDVPNPTADKPQSKIWFAARSWWALLPRKSGPSLWQRTASGWKEHAGIATALAGVPGRADVWFDDDGVTAVTLDNRTLAVLRLHRHGATWKPGVLARWTVPADLPIETATIARDGKRRWWITAPVSRQVLVWTSLDAAKWSSATAVAKGMDKDDICAVTPLPGGVGVIWSGQQADAVYFRRHRDTQPPDEWDAPETVETGNRNADDHINAAVTADGTLWVATKNSVDIVGKPQQVLRLRSPEGRWRNIPYAIREPKRSPSRPVVAVAPDRTTVFYGHTIYDATDRTRGQIVFGRIDLGDPRSLENPEVVIAPAAVLHAVVNNATRAKAPFPTDAPWLILASDHEGRVYEADLKTLKTRKAP
ncbi:MAG: hypothetical protein NTY38_18670 [Acidobacteria bacterium]|nr:hypothetical protein [Acidobacteriota bacterium]